MNRAERRRRAREQRKVGPSRIVTDQGVWRGTGEYEPADRGVGELPDRVPGEHRWIATAGFHVTEEAVRRAHTGDPADFTYLDHENLFVLGLACYDCEQPLGVIQPGSRCPGDPAER